MQLVCDESPLFLHALLDEQDISRRLEAGFCLARLAFA